MIRRQTAALFERAPWRTTAAAGETQHVVTHDFKNVTVRRRRKLAPTTKFRLRPESQATKVPWAAALQVQYKELAHDSEDGALALSLLSTGLKNQTIRNYDGKLTKFIKYCMSQTPPLTPIPAELNTILKYIAFLASSGTVNVDSVQPYLSCINTAHVSVGLAPPAVGTQVEQARKGWRQRQEWVSDPDDKRVPLKPSTMRRVLQHAVVLARAALFFTDSTVLVEFRDAVAVLVTYLFFGRSDTGFGAEVRDGFADLQLHGTDLVFYERKRKGRTVGDRKRTLVYPLVDKPDLLFVLQQFFAVAPSTSGFQWRLPSDGKKWNATVIDDMLQRLLAKLGEQPPAGYKWTSHSSRSGAASAAFSVGVDIIRVCYCGGWAQGSQAVFSYIDPSWAPSEDARYFFGHMAHGARPPVGNHHAG